MSRDVIDGFDFLEGRGTPPPGTPSNVVRFPVEPPAHIATSQRIVAEAGILPASTVATTALSSPKSETWPRS